MAMAVEGAPIPAETADMRRPLIGSRGAVIFAVGGDLLDILQLRADALDASGIAGKQDGFANLASAGLKIEGFAHVGLQYLLVL